jgi:hypothetical protein
VIPEVHNMASMTPSEQCPRYVNVTLDTARYGGFARSREKPCWMAEQKNLFPLWNRIHSHVKIFIVPSIQRWLVSHDRDRDRVSHDRAKPLLTLMSNNKLII